MCSSVASRPKRLSEYSRSMRPRRFVLILVAAVLVVVGALIVFHSSPSDLGCSGFSLNDWRSHHGDSSNARALSNCDALIGKSQPEVVRILGRPTGGVYRTRRGTQVSYQFGSDFLGDSTGYLTVEMGRDGRARHVDFTSRD
jgi:hypothetical protein